MLCSLWTWCILHVPCTHVCKTTILKILKESCQIQKWSIFKFYQIGTVLQFSFEEWRRSPWSQVERTVGQVSILHHTENGNRSNIIQYIQSNFIFLNLLGLFNNFEISRNSRYQGWNTSKISVWDLPITLI